MHIHIPLCIQTYKPVDNNIYIYLSIGEGETRGEEREEG